MFMVLPEEALQEVPSDEEDEEEAHGHAHHRSVPLDPEKQKALRLRHTQMEVGRKKLIKELYVPRHPHLYTLTPEVRATFSRNSLYSCERSASSSRPLSRPPRLYVIRLFPSR